MASPASLIYICTPYRYALYLFNNRMPFVSRDLLAGIVTKARGSDLQLVATVQLGGVAIVFSPPEILPYKFESRVRLLNLAPRSTIMSIYRGFERKGDPVHINTFHVTTRLRSKSNRCI